MQCALNFLIKKITDSSSSLFDTMGKTCADSECPTGRKSTDSNIVDDDEKPSLSDEEATLHKLRDEWRALVPGGEKITSSNPYLCSLHFTPDCFVTERVDKRNNRPEQLSKCAIKPEAMPTLWPNHPWWYRPRDTAKSTAKARKTSQKEFIEKEFIHLDE